MRNERAERRRKKAERRKKKSAKRAPGRHTRQRPRQRPDEFPDFVYDETEGTPEFVALVKDAIRRFHFGELPPPYREAFKLMKRYGAAQAAHALGEWMAMVRKEDPKNVHGHLGDMFWLFGVGEAVMRKIPATVLERFLPMNDVEFLHIEGRRILVNFRSLLRFKSSWGPTYYSRYKPTTEFNGKEYVVGFSKEAIKRVCERIVPYPNCMMYGGLGDVYAYLEHCQHFEPCTLRDGGEAFTFFDSCGDDKRFWQYRYVENVLGVGNLDPLKGKPYYRVGYCPVVFEREFAKAKTLLFPGFANTPECEALDKSALPPEEKARLKSVATNSQAAAYLMETNDFSAINWFHANAVPQVILTDKPVFVYHFGRSRGSSPGVREPRSENAR